MEPNIDHSLPSSAGPGRNALPSAIHMVGNAHLDPAWMWTWDEGMEAFIATCRSALDRMDETPGFIFTCSSAAHYRWVEEIEPALFERIRERVSEGRWAIVGGWWTQADCNLPSGEGFVRQALLGQRYFLGRFGRIARTGYSPDAFGHCLGLPQLLRRAGMSAYIYCRPDPAELPLPSPLLRWHGPDGSSVLAYRVPFHYNMYESSVPKKLADLLAAYTAPSSLASGGEPLGALGREWMIFYGVGNHGGGPTREHLRQIIAADADPAMPDVLFSDPDAYFTAVAERGDTFAIPDWRDDLQLNAPGCYSAHSAIKQLNRMSEHGLAAAERLSTLAGRLLGVPYPADELRRAWENVCFNHFHDILCGVAIREALDDAIEMYGESLAIAKRSARSAVQRLARGIDTTGDGQTLVVFNPHGWDVEAPITFELWHDIDKSLWSRPVPVSVTDDDGAEIPCQVGFTSGKIGRDRIAITFGGSVPALGWRCYRVFYGRRSRLPDNACRVTQTDGPDGAVTLDNGILRMKIDRRSGALAGIEDLRDGREILASASAVPVPIADPTDTWGHGVAIFDRILGKFDRASVDIVENGPTHATVRVISRWNNSWIQQDFRLHRDADKIEVDVRIFWAEQHTMLKLEFSPALNIPRAIYESAYCATEKPCDGIERPGGSWCALIGERDGARHGFGIANNAKHGYSASESTIAITLLRSPSYATHDPHPHHPDEDLDYLDQGTQHFRYILSPLRDGDTTELWRDAGLINAPLHPHLESAHPPHPGFPGRSYRGADITPGNILMTAMKRSEDDDGWIVRLFESSGSGAHGTIDAGILGISSAITLEPYEAATLLIRDGEVIRTDLLEIPLE